MYFYSAIKSFQHSARLPQNFLFSSLKRMGIYCYIISSDGRENWPYIGEEHMGFGANLIDDPVCDAGELK